MPGEQVLREPSHKGFGLWLCVVPATSGKRKRICSTSPLLLLSIWSAVWHGSMAFPALRLDALLLLASMMRLKRVRQWYQGCVRSKLFVKCQSVPLIHLFSFGMRHISHCSSWKSPGRAERWPSCPSLTFKPTYSLTLYSGHL